MSTPPNTSICGTAFRTLLVLFAVVSITSGLYAQTYGITNLGTLGGGFSQAQGINNAGQVVGYSNLTPTDYHIFVYANGTLCSAPMERCRTCTP